MNPKQAVKFLVTMGAACVVAGGQLVAAENATNFYILGLKTQMAGYTPPPGVYLTDINYFYAGSASGNAAKGITLRRLIDPHAPPRRLTIEANINLDADGEVAAPILLWVAPEKVLGGHVGLGVILPFGRKAIDVDIDALATLTLPLLNRTLEVDRRFHFDESTTNLGDPALDALIGWHQGNWHWNLQALLNVPIGRGAKIGSPTYPS